MQFNSKSVCILEYKSQEDINNPSKKYLISLADKCLICNTEKVRKRFFFLKGQCQESKAS